jgi:sporulation protein YlmC with PRC-barrel domain
MQTQPHILSAGTITGDEIHNPSGEKLGELKEIMLDLNSGRVAYAVLSFGGFLGLGDKLFAIPWEMLTLNSEDHAFVLDINKETLENAPGFDKDSWPNLADYESGWLQDVYDFYGFPQY